MTHPDSPTNTQPDKHDQSIGLDRIIELIETRFWSLIFLSALLVAGLTYFGLDLSIPRWLQVFGLAIIGGLPFGYISGNYISERLIDENYIYLVDLNAARIDGSLIQFPREKFRELTIVNEDREPADGYEITQLTPSLYVGRDVDLEDMTVVGTWRGTLSDTELVICLDNVRQCRGELLKQAQRGSTIENTSFSLIRQAVQKNTRKIVETYEKGTLPEEGDALQSSIEDQLDQFGLSDGLSDIADPDRDLDDIIEDRKTETQTQQSDQQPEPQD